MYELACQQCGKNFTARESKYKYCSKECYWKSKERKEQRTCPVCGNAFEVLPSVANRYCSQRCMGIDQQKREIRLCAGCHQEFSVRPSDRMIYCSKSCAAQVNNLARKVAYPIRICVKCGKEFEHKRYDTLGKYCSRQCSDSVNKNPPAHEWISKPCAYCGKLFLCPPWKQAITHCSGKCAKRHQAQTIQGPNHPLWKDKVKITCVVCGKELFVAPSIAKTKITCSRQCAGVLSTLNQQRVSSIEKKILEAMESIDLHPIPQYIIGPFIADFAFPEHRLVIECDGDYWHGNPKQQAKDRRKDGYLNHNGWEVLRLPEHRILSNIDGCVQEIISCLQRSTV